MFNPVVLEGVKFRVNKLVTTLARILLELFAVTLPPLSVPTQRLLRRVIIAWVLPTIKAKLELVA